MSRQKDYSKSSLEDSLKRLKETRDTRFYLSDFAERNGISLRSAEDFFLPLLRANEVEGTLEVKCPHCGRGQGFFKRLSEIPDEFACEICGYDFPPSEECLEIVLEVKGKFFHARNLSSRSDREEGDERTVENDVGISPNGGSK